MSAVAAPARAFDAIDISSRAFWAQTANERERAFAELREQRPISWHRPIESDMLDTEIPGYWAVATNELIRQVSEDSDTFVARYGVMLEDIPEDILSAAQSFLAMDGDEHRSMRRLVSSAFTPRRLALLEERIHARAVRIVDGVLERGSGEFVADVAKQSPMNTIYDIMGLPDEERDHAAELADEIVGWADPDVAKGRPASQVMADALIGLLTIGLDFTERTRANPRDDVWSGLVQVEIDGRRLTDDEIAAFFVLLSVAGNDTTRNTTTLGMLAFQEHPDQRDLLVADFAGRIGPAVEEIVRWASPVLTFRRTAVVDTVLGGQEVRAGDWVAMLYASGNRDTRAFERPETFDLTRTPNPHVGFGGGGAHYCLGNMLAKMQLRHVFEQLLTRAPGLRLGEPVYTASNFVHSVRSVEYDIAGGAR